MSLQDQVMQQMKAAMKSKDSLALQALRSIKSALLLEQTSGNDSINEETELKLLQKLVKQRKDSAALYTEQGRDDLAQPELEEAKIIEQFLPTQLNEEEVKAAVSAIITEVGASTMKDMGKVMGIASKQLGGQADGKTISMAVKQLLS
jgi:uncharacterized protein YqeY